LEEVSYLSLEEVSYLSLEEVSYILATLQISVLLESFPQHHLQAGLPGHQQRLLAEASWILDIGKNTPSAGSSALSKPV
jgi:hypothetical protein